MAKKFARVWVKIKSPRQAKGYRLVSGRKKDYKRVTPTLRYTLKEKKMPRRLSSLIS